MTRTSAEDRRLKRLTDACVWQLYDLRHTFASWLGQCGRTLKEAQEALGHQSIVMPIRDRSSSGPPFVAAALGMAYALAGRRP